MYIYMCAYIYIYIYICVYLCVIVTEIIHKKTLAGELFASRKCESSHIDRASFCCCNHSYRCSGCVVVQYVAVCCNVLQLVSTAQ